MKKPDNVTLSYLSLLIFLVGSFIIFGFFADYILFYQEKISLFVFSKDFLFDNLDQPGGFLIWFGKFFSTFFYNPFIGALLISVVLTLTVLISAKILSFLTGRNGFITPMTIGLLLVYLQTDYHYLFYNNLGLLLQLSIFYLTIRSYKLLRGWIPVIIVPAWYFLTGGFSWIFVFMLISYIALNKEKNQWIKIILVLFITLITLYFSKETLFFQSEKNLLIFPFTELNTGAQLKVFIASALIIALLPIISKIKFGFPEKIKIPESIGILIKALLKASIIVVIGMLRVDKKTDQYFHVEKLFYQNRFDEVIAFNKEHSTTNSLTIFLNNIALCETNKLNDLLFSFPQSPEGKTLFLKWEMVGEILRRGGYFYYTIGMINEAHRWAFENMVISGLSPEGLKMLIRTELIGGNYNMASKYINILKKTLFYKAEAHDFEKLLFNDTAINADKDLGEKRKILIKTDFFSITDDPFVNIEKILSSDSLNIKAFEYKLAFLLLRKDFKGIMDELPRFTELGYTRFPVHIEEATSALSAVYKGSMPEMGKISLSNNTVTRWSQYLSVLRQYKNNPRAAEPALKRQFGNTFWYWVFYR